VRYRGAVQFEGVRNAGLTTRGRSCGGEGDDLFTFVSKVVVFLIL
jgi:hypothetical protein